MTATNRPIDPLSAMKRQDQGKEHRLGSGCGSFDPLRAAHTAEHVLSAVMRRDYGSPWPLETHLGAKKSKCDYCVPRPLGEAEVRDIEAAVNAEIVADHPVTDRLIPADEARDRFDLSKVLDGVERIRIVTIGDLDETPCCGDHVERTSQIGRLEIRSADMRSEDRIRIRFRLLDRVKGAA